MRRLSTSQAAKLRTVLRALHVRDEADGLLPAVDHGPPRGLLDAAVRSVRDGTLLADLHQLPPNVFYAARACQLLGAHPMTAGQLEDWLDRNLAAARREGIHAEPDTLPLPGCYTHEDVRNRLLVEIEHLPNEELERLGRSLDGDEVEA